MLVGGSSPHLHAQSALHCPGWPPLFMHSSAHPNWPCSFTSYMVSMTGSMARMRRTNSCPDSSRTLELVSRSEKMWLMRKAFWSSRRFNESLPKPRPILSRPSTNSSLSMTSSTVLSYHRWAALSMLPGGNMSHWRKSSGMDSVNGAAAHRKLLGDRYNSSVSRSSSMTILSSVVFKSRCSALRFLSWIVPSEVAVLTLPTRAYISTELIRPPTTWRSGCWGSVSQG
mmetsp:Transcript_16123/g.43996  ORF Transcript_16123/g.43996 Transcript_16123/m.43996 type:complete len:227 (+) Transcript_16123:5532-6212(+)